MLELHWVRLGFARVRRIFSMGGLIFMNFLKRGKGLVFRPIALAGLMFYSIFACADVVDINSKELKKLMADGIPVVDVRTAAEWAELGMVEGSEKMTFFDPAGKYDAGKWLSELSGVVDKDQAVILICLTGSRSKLIADWLRNGVGFNTVYNVERGIAEWIGEGNPVVRQ